MSFKRAKLAVGICALFLWPHLSYAECPILFGSSVASGSVDWVGDQISVNCQKDRFGDPQAVLNINPTQTNRAPVFYRAFSTPQDLSTTGGMTIRVTNPDPSVNFWLYVEVYSGGLSGPKMSGNWSVYPGVDYYYSLPFPGVQYDPFFINGKHSIPSDQSTYLPSLPATGPKLPGWGTRAWSIQAQPGFDLSKVTHIAIRMWTNPSINFFPFGRQLLLSDFRTFERNMKATGIVSPYGEMTPNYWGKGDTSPHHITSDQQLVASKEAERVSLNQTIQSGEFEQSLDTYRGYGRGPTGTCVPRKDGRQWNPNYYCVGKVGERWMFLTPQTRKPFFFSGVSGVHNRSNPIQIDSKVHPLRSTLFSQIPSQSTYPDAFNSDGVLADGNTLDFFRVNLYKSFPGLTGTAFESAVREFQLLRMKGWGFTGLAFRHPNWIGKPESSTFPATESHFIQHQSDLPRFVVKGSQNMPDVFNPSFRWIAERQLCYRAISYWGSQPGICPTFDGSKWNEGGLALGTMIPDCLKSNTCLYTDPSIVAHYIDNELLWSDISYTPDGKTDYVLTPTIVPMAALKLSGSSVNDTKRAFVNYLKGKYSTPSDLFTAWGMTSPLATWEQVLSNAVDVQNSATQLHPTVRADLHRMVYLYAEAYFKSISAAFYKYYPNHMYFGPRFASNHGVAQEIIDAARPYVDGLSVNYYTQDFKPTEALLGSLVKSDSDVPLVFTEFHWTATSGNGGTGGALFWTPSLEKWGEAYQRYLKMSVDMPNVIGTHYYRYTDENFLGSTTGEAGSIGFVTLADQPRAALITRVREANARIYTDLATKYGWSSEGGGGGEGGGTEGGGGTPIDSTPPVVEIVNPVAGAVISAGSNYTVEAIASDESGVARVDFYVDGVLVGSDSLPPFIVGLKASMSDGQKKIAAVATDKSPQANQGQASVTIQIARSGTKRGGGKR